MRKVLLIVLLVLPLAVLAKKVVAVRPFAENPQSAAADLGRGKVYIFGVSQLLADSVIYVTNIQEVDSIDMEKGTGFLPYRSEFSLQLKEYMEGTLHLTRQTTCVFYSTSRKKLAKQFYKVKKRYLDSKDMKIVMLDDGRFIFKHPMESFHKEIK